MPKSSVDTKQNITGIVLLDKPTGLTSNAALQAVKRLYRARKAGHTGSLDPLATGMLPICFGEATKFSQILLESDKWYQVTAKLGVSTTTGDADGEIIAITLPVIVNPTQLTAILSRFQGQQTQIPPMYSALKYQGQPLYRLARQGKEVIRQPRQVMIYKLELIDYQSDKLSLKVHCSKGTYIRTLIEDIGAALGCGAHITTLRRLQLANYQDSQMVSLSTLQNVIMQTPEQLQQYLLPLETALANLLTVELDAVSARALQQGRMVKATVVLAPGLVALREQQQGFIGIAELSSDGWIKARRLLSHEHSL